ncbi:SapC family protein [Novosphingobium mangrovi (ex Huang et al. 2023)]|uniref:SapC family protein n=1 Tax=Novosphingobium mangrovi (ex Huang et al. 2023) TaxID=2976432 RepID=A0ABT2I776_9SPHN|nr:SapC family protein [Novosphingobium mangrovi (ex Huang et al. 2023)]MCT2400654.1 SapC family protein [Novosphingobium mangrovi (ex Huang et al. 2023)]
MATAPQNSALPLFYKDLIPLNSQQHANWKTRSTDKATWLVGVNSVPLTVEEFPQAQRNFPIIFTSGENPVPLVLMGMNEGVNVFVDEDGTVNTPIYVPAYVRRYPFMLARLRPDAEELSLCVDPTSDLIGEIEEGEALFSGAEPSETTTNMLKFCENFEMAGSKTGNFMAELKKHDLLMDGELNIDIGNGQPFNYRGFQMVDENKLREVRGDILRQWNQNGMLPLIYAHLFSLDLVRDIFGRQMAQGKMPQPMANA